VTRRLEKGQSIGIEGGTLSVVYLTDTGKTSYPLRFDAANGPRLAVMAGSLALQFAPVAGNKSVTLCN
jgi:hypothetical protein